MFTVLLFIYLPLVFLVHDLEEIVMRRRCMPGIVEKVRSRYPRMLPLVLLLQRMSTMRFVVIVAEELLLIVASVVLFLQGNDFLLLALFWGFCIHLLVHIAQSLIIRRYVPGVVTSLFLLPYAIVGAVDLVLQYGCLHNLLLAVTGFAIVAANLWIMHKIMTKCVRRE